MTFDGRGLISGRGTGMDFDGRGLIRGRGTEEWLFDGRGTTVGIYLFIVYVTGTCSHKDQNPFVQLH